MTVVDQKTFSWGRAQKEGGGGGITFLCLLTRALLTLLVLRLTRVPVIDAHVSFIFGAGVRISPGPACR